MITTPKFKAKFHLVDVPDDGIFLLSENEKHILEGDSMKHIVPLVDGKNSWQDIINKVAPVVSTEDAHHAINILINNGHVIEKDEQMPAQYEAFWSELGRNSEQVKALVSNTNIHVKAFGEAQASAFVESILSFGFQMDAYKAPSLIVVVTDDYQYSAIRQINDYSLAHNIPWLLVKPSGLKMMVGPFISPHKTACWQCLESRLRHNREVESYIQRKTNIQEPFPVTKARVPLGEMQAVSVTVMQMVRWLSQGFHESLESKIMTTDLVTGHIQYHHITKRPQCPACGDPELAKNAGAPITIESKQARGKSSNGSRMEAAETTFQRYAHHISELTGVVKDIAPAPWNGMGPLKVYTAGHNFALKNDELYFIKDGLRSNSSGKGRTDAQAQTSALCEALERYSGVYRGEEPQIFATFKELKDQAINPNDVMLYSDEQYSQAEQWLNKGRFQVVPYRFNEDAKISWTPIYSMTEKRVKYLPTSYLYFGYKDSDQEFYCWGDSNGNAAGSCLEDAILQGFLELIERDSVALWWYNCLSKKQVDLDSMNDEFINDLQAFFNEMGREFWVLDLTSDTGVPTFAAINRRTNHEKEDIIMGFGSHLDARIAINRAITEMNQFIPAVLNLDDNGNAVYHYNDPQAIEWWQTATLANQPYLKPVGEKVHIDKLPSCTTIDLKEQLEQCFAVTEKLGLEVLILNQTRPDIELPVVKVLVPGLRHFWARFAPGRLYDVPVEQGWLTEKKSEEQLNPIPMFL